MHIAVAGADGVGFNARSWASAAKAGMKQADAPQEKARPCAFQQIVNITRAKGKFIPWHLCVCLGAGSSGKGGVVFHSGPHEEFIGMITSGVVFVCLLVFAALTYADSYSVLSGIQLFCERTLNQQRNMK